VTGKASSRPAEIATARFVRVTGHEPGLLAPLARDAIEAACRQAFGSATRVAASTLLRHGGFNTCYRVELAGREPVILRVAPPERAPLFRHERELMAREACVQPLLARLGRVTARILYQNFSCAALPRPYMLLECKPGEPWDHAAARIGPADSAALWREYGGLVRALHAIGGVRFGSPLPGAGTASHADWLLGLFDDLAQDLAQRNLAVPGLAEFRIALDCRRAQLEPDAPPRLVHGDLWPRNVLVTQEEGAWRISAILDAERAFWSEPAAEWIFSHLELPPAFWEAYGKDLSPTRLSGDARVRAIAYQARGALQLILECARSGADASFAHANFARALQALRAQHG